MQQIQTVHPSALPLEQGLRLLVLVRGSRPVDHSAMSIALSWALLSPRRAVFCAWLDYALSHTHLGMPFIVVDVL